MFKIFHRIGSVFLLAALALPASAQFKTVPIGELTDSMRLHPKPALILITTDWCTYCRMQQTQLKQNKELHDASSYLYFSELDAEAKETLVFNDTIYRFHPTGASAGSHELAFALGNINNRLALPTWVLLNENFGIIRKFPGVMKANELSALLAAIRGSVVPE